MKKFFCRVEVSKNIDLFSDFNNSKFTTVAKPKMLTHTMKERKNIF